MYLYIGPFIAHVAQAEACDRLCMPVLPAIARTDVALSGFHFPVRGNVTTRSPTRLLRIGQLSLVLTVIAGARCVSPKTALRLSGHS